MVSFKKASFTIAISSILVACGGGDDSPTPAPAIPTTFPIEAAISAYLTSASAFTTTYIDQDNGDVYTLTYGYQPSGDENFEGVVSKTGITTLNLKVNGNFLSSSTATSYFKLSPFKRLGGKTGSGEYIVAGTQTAYPSTGKIGDLGSIGTLTAYTNSAKSQIISTTTSTWELSAADNSTKAYLCFNSTIKYKNGNPDANVSECYKIDTRGVVIGNKITMTVNGEVLKFIN